MVLFSFRVCGDFVVLRNNPQLSVILQDLNHSDSPGELIIVPTAQAVTV